MNKFKDIKPGNFERILEEGHSLDIMFLLSLVEKKYDLSSFKNNKIEALIRTLERRELILDNSITLKGKELLDILEEKVPKRLKKISEEDSEFESWWNTYPGTDCFSYKGKTFSGSRGLRVQKEDCKLKLKSILNEGKFTLEELISALKREILAKKEDSYKSGENKLKYQINSLSYLNQRRYENWIEKEEITVNKSVIDI